MTAKLKIKTYLQDVSCTAITLPAVCTCHRGYVYMCILKPGHTGQHVANSIHNGTGPGVHSLQWCVDTNTGYRVDYIA
jgi:hypothetical protein